MSSEYIGDIPTAFFRLSTSLLDIHYCHTVKKLIFIIIILHTFIKPKQRLIFAKNHYLMKRILSFSYKRTIL